MPEPEPSVAPAFRGLGYALVLLLTLQLAVWGAFLVPLRVGEVLVPVSWVVALVGNLGLGWAGGHLAGRPGAVVPGVLWLAVAFLLGTKRAEGDLIVTVDVPGVVFLAVGVLSSAVAYGLVLGRTAAAPLR